MPAQKVEQLLRAYLANRASETELFFAFANRHETEALSRLVRGADGMTMQTPPPATPLIPETAPFSAEQRAWLNGFFAGLMSLDPGATPAPPGAVPLHAGMQEGALADGDDGAAPWHDPAMPLEERMQLADGRPLRRRMMAAMAQQDCGQCGYNCEDYSNAIVQQAEPRLNLCVPGGKATARMLKSLVEEMGGGVLDPDEQAAKEAAKPPEVRRRAPRPQPASTRSARHSSASTGSTRRAPKRSPTTS